MCSAELASLLVVRTLGRCERWQPPVLAWRVTYISPCILGIPGINGIMRKKKVSHGSSVHHHSAFHLHSSPPPYILLLLSHQCKAPEKNFCETFEHGRRITTKPWRLLSLSILTIQEHHKETQPNAIRFVAASIRMHSLETPTLNHRQVTWAFLGGSIPDGMYQGFGWFWLLASRFRHISHAEKKPLLHILGLCCICVLVYSNLFGFVLVFYYLYLYIF